MHKPLVHTCNTRRSKPSGLRRAPPEPRLSDIEIEFIGVSKRFPSRAQPDAPAVVRNLDLQIRRGVVLSTIGPSGCDKSRLLNMGSGLYLPIQGEVRVAGQRVTQPVKQESFMLPKDLLMPWRTIAANVELGLEIAGMAAPERRRIAGEWLARCDLQGFGGHWYCVSPMSLQMKSMDSFVRLGANRSHSRRYGEDLQRRLADEDAISCKRFGATQY